MSYSAKPYVKSFDIEYYEYSDIWVQATKSSLALITTNQQVLF